MLPAIAMAALLAACAPKGDALYQRAATSLAKSDYGAALIDLKNLVQSEPQNGRARALLAQASLRMGDLQAAQIEIGKAKELGAPAELTLGTECLIFSVTGDADRILQQCDADRVTGDARADVLYARGQALLARGQFADAIRQFEAAAAVRPDNLDATLGLASVYVKAGDVTRAKSVLDGASAKIKERPRYWYAAGQVAMSGGDPAAAETAFKKAAEVAESNGASAERLQALAGLADVQLRLGKTADARATADKLAQAAPDNNGIKVLRAQIAATAGKYDEARTLLEGVLAKQPGSLEARMLLGMVNLREGNLGQAEMNFSNVVANDPGNVQAQRMLVEIRSRVQSPDRTLEAMKPALEQNADPSLLALAGRLSLASGDRPQAIAYLSQATARPDVRMAPEVQLEIASGFIGAGEYGKAIDLLAALPASSAGSGYHREYLLISALLRKGDKDRALAEARAVLERSGNDTAARNLVAAVYAAAGQADAGREQLVQALKTKPDDVPTLLNLARLDLAEGKSADAEAGFRKVLDIDPKNLDAATGAAMAANVRGDKAGAERWLVKAANDHPEAVGPRISLVQFYLANGDLPKARALVDEAVKKSPDNAVLVNLRGLVLLSGRDGPGAIQSFTEAMRLAPNELDFALNLARAKLLTGDTKGALSTMDGVLASSPKNIVALQLAAAMALQGNETEKAAGYVERLRQVAADLPATDRLEGDLAVAQKRYKDALASYRRAGEKGRDSALVRAEYNAARLAGDANALKGVEQWVAQHPEDAAAVTIVAEARHAAGDLGGAIGLYEQGVARSPNDAILLNNLAVLYREKGDMRAVETARRAYDQAPRSAAIMDTYAWALVQADKVDQALPLLETAVRAEPGAAEIQFHYAVALSRAGRNDDALAAVRKALGGGLPPAVRTDAQKLLKQLSK